MYELVTFDIFDTLLHRKLRAPVDVFEAVRAAVMQENIALLHHDLLVTFSHHRIQAEKEAREIRAELAGEEGEITFTEIYDRYEALTGCGGELRQLLQAKELELEQEFLFASEAGLRTYDELRAKAKRIALVSDMYLPSSWLKTVLQEKGFQGLSDVKIFVSGEFRKSKHSGALYQEVSRSLNVSFSGSWLHVGDNVWADIEQAKKYSLATHLADWAKVDNRPLWSKCTRNEYLVNSVVDFLATPQSRQFVPQEAYASIGYRIFGPLIFGFTIWLLWKIKETKVEHVAFVARDGWLPHKLFEIVKQDAELGNVSSSYLHFSRSVGHQIGLKEWDLDKTWVPFGGKVSRPIEQYLDTVGYDARKIPHLLEQFGLVLGQPIPPEKINDSRAMVATTFDLGLKTSSERRKKFRHYFEKHFSPEVKTGLVDIGWNGNTQRYLFGVLDHTYSKENVIGLYLGLHSSAVTNKNLGFIMHGWLSQYGSHPQIQDYLLTGGVELLEFALTADHGTTLGYEISAEGEIVPKLEDILPEESDYREKAMRVQQGVIKFVEDNKYLLKIYSPEVISSLAWAAPFQRLVTNPQQDELDLLAGLSHSDTAGVTSTRLVLAARQPDNIRKSKRQMRLARDNAFWKVAFDRLNK